MFDGRKILLGIAIFVVLITLPFWLGKGKATPPVLKLDTPEIQKLTDKRCIEDIAYMRARHMELLKEWRDQVVREGNRVYVTTDGREVPISLSRSCLRCHSNKEQFCDACHTYAGVDPNCFQCHIIPSEVKP